MAIEQNILLTVDAIVIGMEGGVKKLLLIERGQDPFKGHWALPGGFVEDDEDLEAAAKRELEEETGLVVDKMEQLYTVGTPGRDPRGRTVSVVYYTQEAIDIKEQQVKGDDDAADAQWFDINDLPPLAFDHGDVIAYARQRLGL